jgi:hypothetical protein
MVLPNEKDEYAPRRQVMNDPLDKFGAFIVQNLRDKMLGNLQTLLHGKSKASAVQQMQDKLSRLDENEKQFVWDLVERITIAGLRDLLFAIQEEGDVKGAIKVLVDEKEIAKLSDGLHGEIFGDRGWIARYSKYQPSKT